MRAQVPLPPLAAPVDELWHVLLDLADVSPMKHPLWTLVGGQMVLLHAVQHGQVPPQVSQDGDVIADVRAAPGAIGRVVDALEGAGFSVDGMSPDLIAHRFIRPAQPRPVTIDVLAPEGLGQRAQPSDGAPLLTPAWTARGLRAVSRPRIVGNRVLQYVAELDGALSLLALDAATGAEVWRRPASTSTTTWGVEPSVEVDRGRAYYYRRVAGGTEHEAWAAAVDVITGESIWRSGTSQLWTSWPRLCGHDLCASAETDRGMRDVRLDLAHGWMRQQRQLGGRELGEGLRDDGDRDPDIVSRVDDKGRQVWREPARRLFGGLVRSSDGGWSFGRFGPLIVGSLGATGRHRWLDKGSRFDCLDVSTHLDGRYAAIRCRMTGTVTADLDTDEFAVSNLDVDIEGFDPSTGATTWRIPVGDAPSMLAGFGGPTEFRVVADEQLLVPDADGGPLLVDLHAGTAHRADRDVVAWCGRSDPLRARDSLSPSGTSTREGTTLYFPCGPDGRPVAGPARAASAIGETADGLFVWAAPDGIRAARTG